jgi:hypothetical protein
LNHSDTHKTKNDLSLLITNFRSVRNKRTEVHQTSTCENIDVVVETESWLTEDISYSEVFPTGYKIYRRDRTDKIGGGVFLAVNSHLNSIAHTFDANQLESVLCTVKLKNRRNIHICSFYRPPDSKIDVLHLL